MSFFLVWRVRLCLRDTWDPFQLNPVGAEKEEKRRCFLLAQYLVAVIVGLAVLTSAVISKVHIYSRVRGWTRGFGKRFGSPRKCWKSISHSKCEFNPWSTTIIATRSIISKKKKKGCPLKRKLHCCVWRVWTLWPHFKTGLPLGAVDALQSHFNAKRKGETVLHTDVGFLPRLPQRPGLYQIPVEMCLQELCATKHKDYVFSRLFFSFHSTQFVFPNKC